MKKVILIYGDVGSGTNTLGNMIKDYMQARLHDCYIAYADNIPPQSYYEYSDYLIVTGLKNNERIRLNEYKIFTIKVNRTRRFNLDEALYNNVVYNNKDLENLKKKAILICEKYLL